MRPGNARYIAWASAATILISITASQILLGLGLASLVATRAKVRVPRIWLPLLLFLVGTLVSLAFSPNPLHGLPQVKKMYVFLMLPVAFSAVYDARAARHLLLIWTGIAAAVACFGLAKFTLNLLGAETGRNEVYNFYLEHRFTGLMSHPMTFAGQNMVVLLAVIALVLFAPDLRGWKFGAGCACAALLGGGLLINGTRSVWLAVFVAGTWLLWRRKRWLVAVAPIALVLLVAVARGPIRDRAVSVVQPRKDVDSNEFRVICFRTGLRMIAAHPLLGIGLDETKYHFLDYLPPDTRDPRPPGFYQHLHNFYLQFAAERGLPTLGMLVWMLVWVLYDFARALRKIPPGRSNERFVLHAAIAAVIGIMIAGLFEVNLGDSEVLTVFLVTVGCGYAAAGGAGTERSIEAAAA